MAHRKGISFFYLQFVLACIVGVLLVGLYLYIQSSDTSERMPLYFPSSTSLAYSQSIDATVYVPEFRIIPKMTVYQRFFRTKTDFMAKKVLKELVLGPHSIYMKNLIPFEVYVQSILIGVKDGENKRKVFIQLSGKKDALTNHDIQKIQHWLQYNMNVYFPMYVIKVAQLVGA